MASSSEAHRAGAWKQANKGHKTGRHRSKGSVEKENRGRVSLKSIRKKGMKVQRKMDRKNWLAQARSLARQQVTSQKKSLGGHGAPPILVALVPLSDSQHANIGSVIAKLTGLQDVQVSKTESGITHMIVPRFKQRFTFVIPKFDSLYDILDVAKVCDNVVFLMCPHTGMSGWGELVLSCVLAQSLPTDPIMVLGSTDEVPPAKMNEVKKLMVKALERKFPAEKIYTVDSESDALNLVRMFGAQKRRPNVLRERRGNLMAESVVYVPGSDTSSGTLELTGFVRGHDMSVNRLVHVPGLGDFQLSSIKKLADPISMSKRQEMEDLVELFPDEGQADLETENTPDGMDGEQTWPTEEELREAEMEVKRKTKRVPKGTSEYQAAWIIEEEEEGGDNDNQEEDGSEDDQDMNEFLPPEEDEEEDDDESGCDPEEDVEDMEEAVSVAGNREDYDAKHVNFSEEVDELEKLKAARMEAMFPDEVDTPLDQFARIRFQKYRGLKSFRTSLWDPKENLPSDYARIFQFENFLRTRKRVLSEKVVGAEVGWYVKVSIKNVGAHLRPQIEGRILTLCSLLPHEQRMSVLNVAVRRSPLSHCSPVKSKERLVFHCGWRRFASCPVFSEHSSGNKHKYQRYFREGDTVVMTTFAPITFPPAPILVFQDLADGTQSLLGTGNLLNVDPDRIIVKRTILSGHPFKVNKRSATVRFMFFNREDIEWFKPIELKTKQGRRGHIKEPLGTHGHMKCIFDGQISQQDSVLLNLYKRVFPKWTYDPYVCGPGQEHREPDSCPMES